MARLGRKDSMRHKYAGEHPMMSGESVTPGKFTCHECGYVHEVTAGVKNLPVCPRCQGEEWELK
jgi:rubrerythrin